MTLKSISPEQIELLSTRLHAVASDLQTIRQLASAAIASGDRDESGAIIASIDPMAARCGRILDLCNDKLEGVGVGGFEDFSMMEALEEPPASPVQAIN